MIFFQIDKSKPRFLYRQIYTHMKHAILEGKFASNTKLPSKRDLAKDLNVSLNSVANAYEQLLEEGYIYTIERKGYFVEDITQFNMQTPINTPPLPDELKEHPVSDEGWLSLSHISVDSSFFPYRDWIKCMQKAIIHHQQELAQISHAQGPYIVRKSIANMIALTRGVQCEPEQIVISTGTQQLIQQLIHTQSLLPLAAVENPGYSRMYHLLKQIKVETVTVNLDAKGVDMKEVIQKNPNFLFVTPSHQFPTGRIMPVSRRIDLLNWASLSNDRYIVEDDYDSEFKYGTDNIPSLQSLDRSQSVIYMGTFSKTLLPSFRISYMVLPPRLVKTYRHHYAEWIQGSSTLNLLTLHYFLESGSYAKHIKKMSNHYNNKRKVLLQELHRQFGHTIQMNDVPAGLHIVAEFKTNKSYEEIEEKAQQEKLEIYTIKRFHLGDSRPGHGSIQLVIGFASTKLHQLQEAVQRLYNVVNS